MRALFARTAASLGSPLLAERQAASLGPFTQGKHDQWMSAWDCMNALECVQPPALAGNQLGDIRLSAWNIERCKYVEAAAQLLASRGVDLVLATEMDWGCARTAQRHTTADLAAQLGFGYVFGVEFVELALGDAREMANHDGEDNLHGLHGNAVLSRFPIGRAALIPLDDGGAWYVSDLKNGQRRIGGRNAIAAEIIAPGCTFWAVAVHFESESTADSRAIQAIRLLAAIDTLAEDQPVVIGGDFNLFELSRQGLGDVAMFDAPDKVEPTFAAFRQAGFDWITANAPGVTTRPHPWQPQDKLRLKIDWMFVRAMRATDPWIAPALAPNGTVISDHDAIGATIHSARRAE